MSDYVFLVSAMAGGFGFFAAVRLMFWAIR